MRLPLAILLGAVASCSHIPSASQDSYGIWDAHTHLSWYGEDALRMLAEKGITSVRDCGGDVEQLKRWRAEIDAGTRVGPRIYFSGPAIDGPKDAKFRLTVRSSDEARRAVDSLAEKGVDFIKTHNALSRETYFAVLAEARRRHLRVASHLPKGVPAWDAADAGVGSIEHAAESLLASPIYAGYAKDVDEAMAWWRSPKGDEAIRHLAAKGVAVTPTLVAYKAFTELRRGTPDYEPRQRALAFLLELTGRLYRGGVVILAGSDFASPNLRVRPGESLLEEIQLLQESGLPRDAALAAAGSNVAGWLKKRPRW